MKISILVPVYNVEQYIKRCAESLFNQTYSDCEYIFVDDCSPDGSINVLEECIDGFPNQEKKVRIVRHDINRGLAAARLTGLNMAAGDCVMFVDSDDFLDLDALEVLVDRMREDKSDIVSAGITHLFENGNHYVDLPAQPSNKKECLKLMLERRVFLNGVARLYKRELFQKLLDPFVEGINFGEDYLMTSRIFYYANRISFVNRPIYNYIHTNSESYTFQFKQPNLDNLKIIDTIISDFYKQVGDAELMECHRVGRLKLKSEQLIMQLRSINGKREDYELIKESFSEDQKTKLIKKIPLQDQLVLKLSMVLPFWIMRLYVKIGYSVKQILKHYRY